MIDVFTLHRLVGEATLLKWLTAPGRIFLFLAIILAAIVAWQCRNGNRVLSGSNQAAPPPELDSALPAAWQGQILPGFPMAVDLEGSGTRQWLYLYRYDASGGRSQIGGVIYSPQINPDPFQLGIRINALPSAFLVPYRLLPDVAPGKGQGYLGDADAKADIVNTPHGKELLVRGYEYGMVTRVSVFWWKDAVAGYGAAHIASPGGLTDPLTGTTSNPGLSDVINAKERLYDRDNLCRVRTYRRVDPGRQYVPSSPALGFCGDAAPASPVYPEGVVLAYLLQLDRPQASGYLTGTAPAEIAALQSAGGLPNRAQDLSVTGLDYPGDIDPQNHPNESTEVKSDFIANGVLRRVIWTVVHVRAAAPSQTPYWLISSARAGG